MDNHGWHTRDSQDVNEVRKQIENLDKVLEGLDEGEEDVKSLSDEKAEMCPMCQEIVDGVVNEKDKPELEKRINQSILYLEERSEQLLPGQL